MLHYSIALSCIAFRSKAYCVDVIRSAHAIKIYLALPERGFDGHRGKVILHDWRVHCVQGMLDEYVF